MCKVDVFIPVYNAEFFLTETIESVLLQTYTNWRIIILDDCSTDKSYDIALEYAKKHKKIYVYRNDYNLGMLNNWNKGIGLCNSDFFVKLDADDVWEPTMLEKATKILDENSDVGLVFSKFVNIDEESVEIPDTVLALPDFAANRSFSCVPIVLEGPDKMLSYPILYQGLSVMRRDIFNKIGTYTLLLTTATQASTDTEFYFRLGCHYQIYCIDEVLYKYRMHKNSISNLDKFKDLAALKIYETKVSIIRYYLKQNKLMKSEGSFFLKKVDFDYNLHLIYRNRVDEKYIKMTRLLLKNLINHPFYLIMLYLGRLRNKVVKTT